jgi:YidC/Oxa1 family membrane protein insertase
MKLYQEHKVNPLASCFPLLLQFPVFIIIFRVLHGLTREVTCGGANLSPGAVAACGQAAKGTQVFYPDYIKDSTSLYQSLVGKHEMIAFGLDLSKRPINVISESFGRGLVYALLVIALGFVYFVQQRMVAARATMSPTMSPAQQKIMQYLPVLFAVFLVFYLTGLVIYYMAQAIIRIGLQYYITHRFYKGEHSLGQQAQRAGARAREIQQQDGGGGGGLFAQAKRDLASAKSSPKEVPAKGGAKAPAKGAGAAVSKRVTPPKNAPTPPGRTSRPASTGRAARPAPRGQQKKK